MKSTKGKLIYKEEEKRNAFSEYYKSLQTTPLEEHIDDNWEEIFRLKLITNQR